MRTILIGWPRVLGPCPAYVCVAASKCFGGCRDLAPMEERGRGPCSRGRHSLLMQHSNSRAHSASRHAKADRGAQRNRAAQHSTHQSNTGQRSAQAHKADKGAQMRSAYDSHWWAPDAWTCPAYRCGGIQVFGGYRDLAPVEECGRGPCSRGRHSLLMQHSTQHNAAHQSRRRRTREHNRTTHGSVAQDIAMPGHTELAEAHRGVHNHCRQQTRHTRRAPPKAHNPTCCLSNSMEFLSSRFTRC